MYLDRYMGITKEDISYLSDKEKEKYAVGLEPTLDSPHPFPHFEESCLNKSATTYQEIINNICFSIARKLDGSMIEAFRDLWEYGNGIKKFVEDYYDYSNCKNWFYLFRSATGCFKNCHLFYNSENCTGFFLPTSEAKEDWDCLGTPMESIHRQFSPVVLNLSRRCIEIEELMDINTHPNATDQLPVFLINIGIALQSLDSQFDDPCMASTGVYYNCEMNNEQHRILFNFLKDNIFVSFTDSQYRFIFRSSQNASTIDQNGFTQPQIRTRCGNRLIYILSELTNRYANVTANMIPSHETYASFTGRKDDQLHLFKGLKAYSQNVLKACNDKNQKINESLFHDLLRASQI